MNCPHCGEVITRNNGKHRMEKKVDNLSDDWSTVATGASRYYLSKLKRRYPEAEFRHKPLDFFATSYEIEARRRA